MTFLEKLELLMAEKNINKRQLSIGSGIPYSTIDNFWKKGYENIKLSNLKTIANYFGVSLDFLVRDNIDDPAIMEAFLNEHEKKLVSAYKKTAPAAESSESDLRKRRLINNYDHLNELGKETLVTYSDDIASMPKYTDEPDESRKQA